MELGIISIYLNNRFRLVREQTTEFKYPVIVNMSLVKTHAKII